METPPPPIPTREKTLLMPQTSGLAISSLVLSLIGVSLPAVICGHVARSRIAKSGGMLRGDGMAAAGVAIGYIGMVIGLLLVLPWIIIPGMVGAKAIGARGITKEASGNLVQAVIAYQTEYGSFPVESGLESSVFRSDEALMNILLGSQIEERPGGKNIRAIKFYSGRMAEAKYDGTWHSGMIRNEHRGGELFDAWGGHFFVLVDSDGDGQITMPEGAFPNSGETIEQPVLVWSAGKDGLPGTGDDITSW